MNKRTDEQTNRRTNEQENKRTDEQTNRRMMNRLTDELENTEKDSSIFPTSSFNIPLFNCSSVPKGFPRQKTYAQNAYIYIIYRAYIKRITKAEVSYPSSPLHHSTFLCSIVHRFQKIFHGKKLSPKTHIFIHVQGLY